MIHPNYRRRGLDQQFLKAVDDQFTELYTCTKSWKNIRLYEKMGYQAVKEVTEDTELSFVYMQKR